MDSQDLIRVALAGLIALGATQAAAQMTAPSADKEKCYGISKAGISHVTRMLVEACDQSPDS